MIFAKKKRVNSTYSCQKFAPGSGSKGRDLTCFLSLVILCIGFTSPFLHAYLGQTCTSLDSALCPCCWMYISWQKSMTHHLCVQILPLLLGFASISPTLKGWTRGLACFKHMMWSPLCSPQTVLVEEAGGMLVCFSLVELILGILLNLVCNWACCCKDAAEPSQQLGAFVAHHHQWSSSA